MRPACFSKVKRSRILLLTSLLLPAVAAIGIVIHDGCCVGRVIDSYKGVSVYDNGVLFFRSHGRNYSKDGYYFGQKWQCVEYVKRFYYQAMGRSMPDGMGHAKSFFDVNLPDGGLNQRRGLAQFRNGSSSKPAPDDLLVFTDTRFGHVAIVTKVDEHSVEAIQQNVWIRSRQSFTLENRHGHYFIVSPREPAGWLRMPR